MTKISSYPHITPPEFSSACTSLLTRFTLHQHAQKPWLSMETMHKYDTTYLRISKALSTPINPPDQSLEPPEPEDTREDDDEEALLPSSSTKDKAMVHYDIHLSPTYRLPVLHIHIADPLHRYPPTMSTLYAHIIPPAFRAQTSHVGLLGGITVTDHPVEGRPVFFIHPCRTAEVLEACAGGREVEVEEYLLVWIGALGGCVGLDVPVEMAAAVGEEGAVGQREGRAEG